MSKLKNININGMGAISMESADLDVNSKYAFHIFAFEVDDPTEVENNGKAVLLNAALLTGEYDLDKVTVENCSFDFVNGESSEIYTDIKDLKTVLDTGSVLFLSNPVLHSVHIGELINIFNNPVYNAHHAQLFIVTYSIDQLSESVRSDEVWIWGRPDGDNGNELYSIIEFDIPLHHPYWVNWYYAGKFGSLPCGSELANMYKLTLN